MKPSFLFDVIKQWVQNFDITPTAPRAPEYYQQAEQLFDQGNLRGSIEPLEKIISNNPRNLDAVMFLSYVLIQLCEYTQAHRLLKRTISYYPREAKLRGRLGYLYNSAGEKKKAIASYRKALDLDPKLESAQHLLNGLEGNTSTRAPINYIVGVFDDFAASFDEVMINHLDYKTPTGIGELAKI